MTVPPYQPPPPPPQVGWPQPSYVAAYAPPTVAGPPGWPPPPMAGGQPWTGFPAASPAQVATLHHTGHRRLVLRTVIILAVVIGVAGVLGKATTHAPAVPNCVPITCVAPPGGQPVVNGQVYTSSEFGFTVHYAIAGLPARATTAKGSLTLTLSPSNPALRGTVQFVGLDPQGQSASAIVAAVQQQVAPNANQAYVVPGPMVGYQPGYGAAYDIESTSSDGTTERDRVVILAAVRGNLAIVVIAAGPYLPGAQASNITGHPTPVDLAAAIFGDPPTNSVRWPGENLP